MSNFLFYNHLAGRRGNSWVVKTLWISKVTLALTLSVVFPSLLTRTTTSWLFWEGREAPRPAVGVESQLQNFWGAQNRQPPALRIWPATKNTTWCNLMVLELSLSWCCFGWISHQFCLLKLVNNPLGKKKKSLLIEILRSLTVSILFNL